ncbi:FMRFamide receptor [Orchesella cincta]|uniref:FMRFamide receptor n=1 Tax=Orchesella cincta TaxID=48709 RepID=A0A1D2M7N7_ORCCI|nr:FMRFamide receptor [Orchesella cincta]
MLDSRASTTILGYWTCYFLEPSANNVREEFISPVDNVTVYRCSKITQYLLGSNAGPTICVILCVLITIVGIFGLLVNILSIIVLRRSMKGSALQHLLVTLAVFDISISVFAILTVILLQIILDNVNRSKAILCVFWVTALLYSLGRTGSVFTTILVSIERYLVVVYPFRARIWLSGRRSLVLISVWLLGIILINIPWWLVSVLVDTNLDKFPKGKLSKYPYIYVATNFSTGIYTWLRPIHDFVDFVMPLPLLLIFNALLFRSIYNWNKRREILSGKHTREINAAKMFAVIVIAVFSCHTFGVINFVISQTTQTTYRELVLSIILTVTLNSTVNFFVYYWYGQSFRDHFWYIFGNKILGRKEYIFPLVEMGRTPDSSDMQQDTVHFDRTRGQNEQCRLLGRMGEDELFDIEFQN